MIDQRESEVLSWALAIVDNKKRAEQALAAKNPGLADNHRAAAEAARQKLSSLGYPWVASAISADGATAEQARLYVGSLRRHLDKYDGGNTPALSLTDALGSGGGGGFSLGNFDLGGLFGTVGTGLDGFSQGARLEADSWLDVVKRGVGILLPVIIILGFVKAFRVKANIGR